MKCILSLLLIIAFFFCKKPTKTSSKLGTLYSMMQGTFNFEKQAKTDSTYYNISLHMHPI